LISKPADKGDIAVPSGQALTMGIWNGSTLDARININSSGNTTISGRTTLDIQGGVDFYDGTTNRGRLRASTATSRIVSDVAFNVDGLLTASAGLTVVGALTLPANSITNSMIAADAVDTTEIAAGAVGQTELSTTAIFKSVTPTTIGAVASAAAGWSGATGAASLRRFTGTVTSERAFKSDISAIAPETDKYELLNWISFRYDAQKMRDFGLVSAGIDYEVPDKKNWGLIADELQELFPEAVVLEQTDEGSFRGINYQTLRAIEGMVIKDLIGRVKSLEARVAELEG
jgi:hypothetical protein